MTAEPCWESTTAAKNNATPSIKSSGKKTDKKYTIKQSNSSYSPSPKAKTQQSSPTDPLAQAKPTPCSATTKSTASSNPQHTQRTRHSRHLPTHRRRQRQLVQRSHQLRRNLQRNDQRPTHPLLRLPRTQRRRRKR